MGTGADASTERHISGSTTSVIVAHVQGIGGMPAVDELLRLAGETRSAAEVRDPDGWSTYGQATALFEAAVAVTGDPEVGRRIGETLLRQHAGTEVAALLRSLGSP